MIWLTWRQHRRQALFASLGLAAVAALVVPTGLRMRDAAEELGLPDCLGKASDPEYVKLGSRSAGGCGALAEQFLTRFDNLQPLGILFIFLPLLVGLFFGAPLVAREIERGTHRLVWTQGVSRLRWAMVKFGLVGATALALAAGYAALLTWWIKPLNSANGSRFDSIIFDLQGVAPIGYTLLAVALGVFAGTVTRKVQSAMAITLVGFIGVRLLVTSIARPNFLPQKERRISVVSDVEPNRLHGDWVLGGGVYDSSGHLQMAGGQRYCPPGVPLPPGGECDKSLYNLQVYQPADRFWIFQTIETGLYVALAVILLALAVHRVRRRLS
jgi:hypothetical protein